MTNPLAGTRQIVRALLHSPAFTASAVLTLALGMAATTVVFSTFYHLVLRPLPFDDWQNLSFVYQEQETLVMGPSPTLAREAVEHATTFAALEAWTNTQQSLTGTGEPVMLSGGRIGAGLPGLLGVAPLLGRTFTDEEAHSGARVVLLSEPLWRSRFGGEQSVLGRAITLGADSWTVVGVMPAHFGRFQTGGTRHDYWLPLQLEQARFGINLIARLRPGTDPAVAEAELDAMAAALPPGQGSSGPGWRYALKSAADFGTAGMNTGRTLPRLFGAAALLLLISCANVAGLLLIRMHTRRREFAIRAALGAWRNRLLRELAMEQLIIGGAAGGIGVLLAFWSVELIRTTRPEQLASLDHVVVSVPVLAFSAALVLLTTLLFGTLPALALLRRDLAGSLQAAGGPRLTSGARTRSVLVTLQLALSTLLLVAGFLLVRTVAQLERRDLGFDTAGVLIADIPLPGYRYTAEARSAFLADLAAGLREVQGVRSVGFGNHVLPEMGVEFAPALEAEGSDAATSDIQYVRGAGVSPGYFATLGVRMVEGREYAHPAAENTVIVNQAFAERFWPGQSAVGRRFRLQPTEEWKTIIGVTGNMRVGRAAERTDEPMMFWPMLHTLSSAMVVLRTDGDPLGYAAALRQVMARLDPDLPIRDLESMQARMSGTIAEHRFNMLMIALFAAAAVLLCAVGLYGLVSYSFQQRVREVGVRMALGATPGGIRTLFLSQALRLAAVGVPLGLLAAFASASVTAALVHGVSPRDPLAYAGALAMILLIVLPAGWLPARRAARLQPLDALRPD